MGDGSRYSIKEGRGGFWIVLVFVSLATSDALAQVPGLPVAAAAKSQGVTPAKKEGGETVTTVSGPIKVENDKAHDQEVEHYLEGLLRQVPGVRNIDATVKHGVVFIDGQVDDDDTRQQITGIAGKVEGLNMVINRLAIDAEVLTAPALLLEKVRAIWEIIHRRWLLGVLALGVVMIFSTLARLFNTYSETLLAPFLKNVMLRSVIGSLIGSGIVLGGLVFGLSILNLTHAVLSILGLASIVGLAVGFAFKDITENFIASVLLGVRRPFQVGDYVTVAGQTGAVLSLNSRATVLVTLEGNHIRIPNNIIYKEILVNATASVSFRANLDVRIPYEASTAGAIEAMTSALRQVPGVLSDPPARALVEALEPEGVRLKGYYWIPVQNVDWLKINSDARLRVKVALQQAHALTAAAADADIAATSSPTNANGNGNGRTIEANLRKDVHALETARNAPASSQPSPVERVMSQGETRVSDEGTNLLATASKEDR